MAKQHTTKPRRRKANDRPPKPYKEFPLYAHPSGHWAKKVRGNFHYFGRWGRRVNGKMERLDGDGWEEALTVYKAQIDDLQAGRTPRKAKADELTVADLCNAFLNAKLRRVTTGELSQRSFAEYKQTTDRLIAAFGKNRLVEDLAADDFAQMRADIAKTCGPVRLGNEITRTKSVFKYATDNALIAGTMRYGSEFQKPGKSVMRRHKSSSDKKLFTVAEVKALLDEASPTMKAAILLGINAGAGNTDVSNLEFRNLDLKGGWLHYPRGKTGIDRRCPLWQETVKALRQAIAARPKPKLEADEQVVLLSGQAKRLVRITEKSRTDGVTTGFSKLLRKLKINGRRGLGFYSLRHTFATIGLETGDRDAVKSLMGHAEGDVLSLYDESGPSDARLLAVTKHVRKWLFGKAKKGGAK